MIQCTIYESENKIINTEYGLVNYLLWLSKEQMRIATDSVIKKNKKGLIALYVSDNDIVLENCKYHSRKL
jgi:hypothetical protein